MTWLACGGAPLGQPTAEAYQAAGLLLLPGYGLTESAPVISFTTHARFKKGTVGPPMAGVEVRIAADGEILCRGPNVMKGYWKDPQATAEALRDGWLHTGDLGELGTDGFLKITGRKKELLVLSNGKKVVPSYVEGLLLADSCIDQAVVAGEGRHFLSALIVPNWDNLRCALHESGHALDAQPAEALTKNASALAFLGEKINQCLAQALPWEQVKRFVVLPRPFSIDGDELTVSLKLRRSVILKKYAGELESLYREGASERGP
jgi:long-chain acyl-CoA synthetase